MFKLLIFLLLAFANAQVPTTKSPTLKPTAPTKAPTFRPTSALYPAKIYLYSNNVWEVNGNLGSRTETNWYCENIAVTLNLFCVTHAAFLSYSSTDSLKNIPSTHLGASSSAIPVYSASGNLIANSWNDLFTYPRSTDFITSGVLTPDENGLTVYHYTGSNSDGTFSSSADTCNVWSDNTNSFSAYLGQGDATDETSMIGGLGGCDGVPISAASTSPKVVCACFYDGS